MSFISFHSVACRDFNCSADSPRPVLKLLWQRFGNINFFGFTTSKWNFIPTVDIQTSRHWLACCKELSLCCKKKPYNDQHNEPIFYLPMIRCLDDHHLQLLSDACHILVIGAMAGHASSRRSDALSLVKVRHARCLTWSGQNLVRISFWKAPRPGKRVDHFLFGTLRVHWFMDLEN